MTTCRERTILAKADIGRLELCSCGTVHLSIGPITMRLPAAAIPRLRDLLETALNTDPRDVSEAAANTRRRIVH